MIEAKEFIEAARELGFVRYTGVPCSFLTPFINYVINDNALEYIASTNEGDALATTSGSVIGGQRSIVMMQNSGLGNLINPMTSLCIPFNIRPFLVIGHRHTLAQHKIMGEIDLKLLELVDYGKENYYIYYGENNVK